MKLNNSIPVLFVRNAGISRDFYVQVLGLKLSMDFDGTNLTFEEGFSVWQVRPDNIIPQTLGVEKMNDSSAVSRFELCFETDDLDAVYSRLKEAGVTFLHEINTEIWGQRTIRFYDPDGHLIEVGEAMRIFLRRIFDEENHDYEATSRRTFVPVEGLKYFLSE